MIEKILTTKEKLLNAFDLSEKKTIGDTCKIAGVKRETYYFHFYKDAEFRKAFLQKKQEHLNQRIEAIAA